jgi:hypothetical protein
MKKFNYHYKFIRGFFKNWSTIKKGIYYTVIENENLEDKRLNNKMKKLLSDFKSMMEYKQKIECTPELYEEIQQNGGILDINKLIKPKLTK